MSDLLQRIAPHEKQARALEARMADPGLARSPGEYGRVAKQLARAEATWLGLQQDWDAARTGAAK